MQINSSSYWDQRFRSDDWVAKGGCDQTYGLMLTLVKNLPEAVLEYGMKDGRSIVDIGCAEGEGVVVLKDAFPTAEITGTDISEEAILRAREKHLGCLFEREDLMRGEKVYDICVSSNVLEHFVDPRAPFEKILRRARRFALIMVPFRDTSGCAEHRYVFDFGFFPLEVDGMRLVYVRVFGCAQVAPYWSGYQLLCVYERKDAPVGMMLSDYMNGVEVLPVAFGGDGGRKNIPALKYEKEINDVSYALKVAIEDLNTYKAQIQAMQNERGRDKEIQDRERESAAHRLEKLGGELERQLACVREAESKSRVLARRLSETEHVVEELNDIAYALREKLGRKSEEAAKLSREVQYRTVAQAHVKQMAYEALNDTQGAFRNIETLIYRMNAERKSRFFKLLVLLNRPALAHCASTIAVLWKRFVKKEPLAPEYSIYQPIQWALADAREKCAERLMDFDDDVPFAGEVCIFATVPYDDVGGGQRSAQMTRCFLARGYRVIYVYKYPKVENGIKIANVVNTPRFSMFFFGEETPDSVFGRLKGDPMIVIFEMPHADYVPFLDAATQRGWKTVYELIDPWETNLGEGWYSVDVERHFAEASRVVAATAKVLQSKLIRWGRNDCLYCPNAADERYFPIYSKPEGPNDLPTGYEKIILYFGSLYGSWFDWGWVRLAAERNPRNAFVLIGDPPVNPDLPKNVYFLGMKKNAELNAYLHASDAAIIPFISGPLVDAVSPIKAFEYLFSGTPVITGRMPELDGYPGVFQAGSADEFSRLCSLDNVKRIPIREVELFLARNNWNARIDQLLGARPLRHSFSIVTLIHNNVNVIGRFLSSLRQIVEGLPVEVIVVDNASEDEGADVVLGDFGDWVTLLRNCVNGCSSGRNMGVAAAHGEIVVFFDSDQWFTSSSWLYEMDFLMSEHPEIGAFSWNAGWFEDKELHGPIVDYLPNRACDEEYSRIGYRKDVHYLATSGMCLYRDFFNQIGGLDVKYDPTIFEDTDLSMKIIAEGRHIAYHDFQGIMHQPHQTTKASSQQAAYKDLWKRNLEYFRGKWMRELATMIPQIENV